MRRDLTRDEAPRHQFVDAALRMSVENGSQSFGDVGDGVNVVQLARRDDGGEQLVLSADLMSGE